MKILLLGKDGQVGTSLQRTLLPLGELIAIGRSDLDLEDLSGLNQLLANHHPDIIVNAAAYTAVDRAESDKEKAFLINADMVKVLADYTENNRSLLVHYSTDYVFDGLKSVAYIEADSVNPQSIYGASKRAGEEAILQSNGNYLIFRTSWVFSVGGKNFIKTILNLAKEKERINVVSDQYGAPTSAELIADVTAVAISRWARCALPTLRPVFNRRVGKGAPATCPPEKLIVPLQLGIYHLTASGATSWYNLACYIVNKALENGMTLKLTSQHIHPISTDEYPLPAKRPKNSILNNTALSNALALHLPDWTVHVDKVMDQLTQMEHST